MSKLTQMPALPLTSAAIRVSGPSRSTTSFDTSPISGMSGNGLT